MKADLANNWIMMCLVPYGVEDIRDVRTAEDFAYWRGLRSARAAAARNAGKENAGD